MTIESTFGVVCMVKYFLFCALYNGREKKESNVKIGKRRELNKAIVVLEYLIHLNIKQEFVILYYSLSFT